MQILLVDDDRELVDLLAFALRRSGLRPLPSYDGPMALELFEENRPDLVVLDVNLGASNGLDVLKSLRVRSTVPVIMLTASDAEEDKVRGLNLGAYDYLTKPFSHRELIARIQAQLRGASLQLQTRPALQTRFEVGPLVLDVATHAVTKRGQPVSLTVTEFRLLHTLMLNAGTVVPTPTLLDQVWGYPDVGGTDVVRVTVHRLRRKLEDDAAQPALLHTIAGVGFLMTQETRMMDNDARISAKIIGVEIKALNLRSGEQAELAMFGCQIPIPTAQELQFEVTLHTSQGDLTFGRNDCGARRVFLPMVRGSLGEHASRLHP